MLFGHIMSARGIEPEADRVCTQERPQPPHVTGFACLHDEHQPACFIRWSEPAAGGTSPDRSVNRLEQQRDPTQSVEDRAGRQVESSVLPHRQPAFHRQVPALLHHQVLREQHIDEHRIAQVASGNELGGQGGGGDNWLRRALASASCAPVGSDEYGL